MILFSFRTLVNEMTTASLVKRLWPSWTIFIQRCYNFSNLICAHNQYIFNLNLISESGTFIIMVNTSLLNPVHNTLLFHFKKEINQSSFQIYLTCLSYRLTLSECYIPWYIWKCNDWLPYFGDNINSLDQPSMISVKSHHIKRLWWYLLGS